MATTDWRGIAIMVGIALLWFLFLGRLFGRPRRHVLMAARSRNGQVSPISR